MFAQNVSLHPDKKIPDRGIKFGVLHRHSPRKAFLE